MAENKSTKVRELLWPIYGKEHRIWLPMATMVGLILFNYTVARNMKDSLVVTATGSAAIIPFLKGVVVLPASVVFFLFYAKLAHLVPRRSLFYIVVSGFLLFYIIFAFVLYPAHDLIHPTTSADAIEALLPAGFEGLVDCYRVWTFSLFYVCAELWGVVVNGLLFWQFANDVIHVKEAKRFYPYFYILANVFVSFSGVVVSYISLSPGAISPDVDDWGIAISRLTIIIISAGIVTLLLYAYLDRVVFKQSEKEKASPKNKIKSSMWNSIKHVLKSPYLGLIALLIISYGVTANLIELTWKRQLGLLYTTGNEYAAFMGYLSIATGIGTILAIFLGSIMLRKLGWLYGALATPIAMGITGALFYFAVIFPGVFSSTLEAFKWTPIFFTVLIGFVLEVLVKSIKYALFDPTKEMAYIPLDVESKVEGKAAVDVVGNRLGKSGGGFIEIFLITVTGTLGEAIRYFAVIFLIFSGLWTAGVFSLNRRFIKACQKAHED
jgi:AAA family ATP:ADP antiporter